MDLNNYNDAELRKELERREKLRNLAKRPKLLEKPDYTELVNLCETYLTHKSNNDLNDDAEHYIFETVMITLYGEDAFDKINALGDDE